MAPYIFGSQAVSFDNDISIYKYPRHYGTLILNCGISGPYYYQFSSYIGARDYHYNPD